MNAIKISVVIIVKNELNIKDTIDLLYHQILELGAECVVVDASTPPLSALSTEFPWVRWFNFSSKDPDRHITIAEQRNFGVAESIGEIIVFCDAGGSPGTDWLENLVKPLVLGESQLVGGPIRATNKSSNLSWVNLQQDGAEIRYPSTANLAVTRSAFDLVSGFNESLDYGSDADLVWRLNAQGIKQVCVASAVMGLDGGTAHRERKRAWRYGKALSDLMKIHPERRIVKLRQNPELLAYLVLIVMPLFFFLPAPFYIGDLSLWLLLNIGLLIRNRKEKKPFDVILNHYIYEAGLVWRTIAKLLPTWKIAKVAMYPSGDSRYLAELKRAFFNQRDRFQPPCVFPELTPSATLNLILLPFTSFFLRLRGLRMIHIHSLYKFELAWFPGTRVNKTLVQILFKFWIKSLKISGIEIIWTAHNLMPHKSIFKDDMAMRRYLLAHCEAVIALSEETKSELISNFEAKNVFVIPEGPIVHPTTYSRKEFRKLLGVTDNQILHITLGQLAHYKGLEELLAASIQFKPGIALIIAGWCSPEYEAKLRELEQEARRGGATIQIHFGKLTDNLYGAYLNAADFYVTPFSQITNSGSINAAVTAGLPVVVPDLKSLSWVPAQSAIRFHPGTDRVAALAGAVNASVDVSEDFVKSLGRSSKDFIAARNWSHVAESHIAVYGFVMDAKNEMGGREIVAGEF